MIAPAGRKLGKYEIRQKLGRGGMADVYLADDGELHHPVALKLIEHAADPEISEIIEAERRGIHLQAHLAAIDSRVVRIYDSGDLDGYFYVAMEYVDGQDLAELLRRGPLAPEAAVDIAIAVAETLEHAHTLDVAIDGKDFHGIVHGDIKPKNIRIDSRGQVRVLDFGIAKALSLSRRLTRNEYGSVPYASPERLDFGQVDASSDLWSLGVMLYEMVTGLQPYQADSTERLERMILSRIPPPPAPDPCPEPLRRILRKAMAPDADMRYRDARSFAADLRAFREGRPVEISNKDLDATRRTYRTGDATRRTIPNGRGSDTETRRTSGPLPNGRRSDPGWQAKAPAPPVKTKPGPNLFLNFMRFTGAVILASLLYGAWTITAEYLLWKHGQQLERAIETEQITDPDQIWARWTELSKGNPSSWLLYGPRKVVRQKFLDAADRVIDAYRTDTQAVYEKDWERARTMAQRALSANPDDDARYRLRLADGQIARINGTAHNSAAELNLAVEDFTEAHRLMPKSPDPELGLARVYVYGFKDIDRAWQALQQASRLGYSLGNREKQQLADGYRARADSTWWDSRKVRGLPEEKDQISRAAGDYKRALQLYQQIAPYGNANASIVRVGVSLVAVEFRLHQLDPSLGRETPQ
ncbi:MAG TPA: serine/threonine-protein kinase [Bryobacteraceae bacterium]|nr:serine/threonine-protein kinase [Bryobacteraceae bacterium]